MNRTKNLASALGFFLNSTEILVIVVASMNKMYTILNNKGIYDDEYEKRVRRSRIYEYTCTKKRNHVYNKMNRKSSAVSVTSCRIQCFDREMKEKIDNIFHAP